jgi:hypothetical protein
MTLSSVPPAKSDGGLTRKRKRQQSPHAAKKKKVAADRTSTDAAEKNVAKMMDLFVRKITDVVDAAAQECMETLTDVICEKLEAVEKTRQVDADTIIYMLQELDNNSSSSLTSDPVDFPAREIKTRRTPRSKGQKQQQQQQQQQRRRRQREAPSPVSDRLVAAKKRMKQSDGKKKKKKTGQQQQQHNNNNRGVWERGLPLLAAARPREETAAAAAAAAMEDRLMDPPSSVPLGRRRSKTSLQTFREVSFPSVSGTHIEHNIRPVF